MANKQNTVSQKSYNAEDFGETELMREFYLQLTEARSFFLSNIKPRLDRSYKLYIAYNGDRQKEIQKWQANIFVPYIQAVVETLMPRILDARPDFGIQGRTPESEEKATKLEYIADYLWEKAGMDSIVEDLVRSAMVFGTGYLQVYWKKDQRELQFLKNNDLSKKLVWKTETRVFYDAPSADWIDNYNLWYDWRNVNAKEKRFWFKRLILTRQEIERRYPMADPKKMALIVPGGDVVDYAQIRRDVKLNHQDIGRGRNLFVDPTNTYNTSGVGSYFENNSFNDLYEVFEWWRPFKDKYSVVVNNVPILKNGELPNPYDFKESPFIAIPYLKIPGEFEGYGLPMILENPQIMLNMIKNQRLDAVTLNIHKMWIVNPLANIDKKELVTRPFGIVYSTDPNGVREIQFSDVKSSAFEEEKLIKNDMRYASGVDDFSMGAGGGASSATEVRHLRESTIERVRLFVNHLGDGFATLQRYWLSMLNQFFTEEMTLRIIGQDGKVLYPLIQKDDLEGEFDFRATVLPSIAGQNEIKKKQDMDLLQLLMGFPQIVDPQKLIAKILYDWQWNFNDIAATQQAQDSGQMNLPAEHGAVTSEQGFPAQEDGSMPTTGGAGNEVPPEILSKALAMLGGNPITVPPQESNPFAEAATPISLDSSQVPPTVPGVQQGGGGPTSNPRGLNRTGKVNTNIPLGNKNANPESSLINRTFNIQK